MARIAGVDIPSKNKRMVVALTYLYGIGPSRAKKICSQVGINESAREKDLTEDDLTRLRNAVESQYKIEGDLRRENGLSIKRLMDLGCYRGIRHRRGLPVRGQSTRQNARTRKGPKKTVAGKRK